ncbi:hypothetical protein [Actinoplanes sp. NPDC026623]|uniref:hypothetical protein n=1 Tax=Actinoplanes sp. NPDC026623 TaxID=3155610 RepID=UPI00340BA509
MAANKQDQQDSRECPIVSARSFGVAGEPIVLHEGMIESPTAEETLGSIYLSLDPVPDLRWKALSESNDFWTEDGNIRISFKRPSGSARAQGVCNTYGEGSLNGVQVTRPGARLQHAIFHWVNLPPIAGNIRLEVGGTDWGRNSMAEPDRLRLTAGVWDLVLDRRADYEEVVKDAKVRNLYALTHVMDIRRTDGFDFDAEELEPLSEALRSGLSFAFGRWVSPAMKVGYGHGGEAVWESWGAPICDPYKSIGSPIIYWGSLHDVTDFIQRVVDRFGDPERYGTASFQMFLAAQTAELGFVENRIFSAFPAIENLSWVTLKLEAERSNSEYESIGDAAARLRVMLELASIPLEIAPESLPGLYSLAEEKGLDGPGTVVWVRNRLVHPKDPHDTIYGKEHRFVVETWYLSRNYLALLVLHSIGYRGGYLPAVPPFGYLMGAVPVPWV